MSLHGDSVTFPHSSKVHAFVGRWDQEQVNILQLFAAIHQCAKDMADLDANPDAHPNWRSACAKIICASRRAEELLQPLLLVEVFAAESDVFTHPTASHHPEAPVAGSATAVTWSVTEEARTQGEAEAAQLVEETSAGDIEAKMRLVGD